MASEWQFLFCHQVLSGIHSKLNNLIKKNNYYEFYLFYLENITQLNSIQSNRVSHFSLYIYYTAYTNLR